MAEQLQNNDILEAVRPALHASLADLYGQNPAKALNQLGKALESRSLQLQEQPNLKLYGDFNYCPNVWRIQGFLDYHNIPYSKVEVDLLAGDNRKPEYLKINPLGLVPALVDEANQLTAIESGALLMYVDRVWGKGVGTPGTPGELAEFCELWYRMVGNLKSFEPRYMIYGGDLNLAAARALHTEYKYLEQKLASADDRLFLASDKQPSILDFLVLPNLMVSIMSGLRMEAAGLPKLEAWRQRMLELPGVAEGDILHGWQRGLKRKQGLEWDQRLDAWAEYIASLEE